jgi:DNA-binding transcriptional LysR family regulator
MATISRSIIRRLKLRQLEIYSAVVDCKSMGRAAQQLSVSQPVISKSVADLERTLGVPLLDRSTRGVEPTRYGEALLRWSGAVFDDLGQAVNEIGLLSDPAGGELRIGCTGAMIEGFLPAILTRLRARYPRLAFDITEASATDVLYRRLRDRDIDLIIGRIGLREQDDEFAFDILFDEPLLVVAGMRNPLARRRRLALRDLMDEPWLLPPRGTAASSVIAETFAVSGLQTPRSGVIYGSTHMHASLVANGPFVAMAPACMVQFAVPRQMKALPVSLPDLSRPVGIVTVKGRMMSSTARRFIQCAREMARRTGRSIRVHPSP